jgi:RimJ/RimL family protein N-acetyltransferase
MTDIPELRTERLLMRGWRGDDFDAFVAILADPDVGAGLGREGGFTPTEVWRDMALLAGSWTLSGFGHWVLEDADSREIVGRAGLFRPPDWPDLEVGWTVARAHWGKGYAPEAARAACEWAHAELGAKHIVSLIEPSNQNSIRVAEKLGERHEGEHTVHAAAGRFDLLVYGADLPLGSER